MAYEFICFGEVLFDVLPNERKAGGAPMNVAYHLIQQGGRAAIISSVGSDEHGRELLQVLTEKNIPITHIQQDEIHETGIVLAQPVANGDMQYEIKEHVAWDFIHASSVYEELVTQSKYFIFGSLVTRNIVSRNTLFELLDIPTVKVFDINIRPPFFDLKNLTYQLKKTTILKLNAEELALLIEWLGAEQFLATEDRIRFLQDRFQIKDVIVTRGANGAIVNINGTFYENNGIAVKVVDTIGSGDSFLAGFLAHLANGVQPQLALDFASKLGAFVATQSGACPPYTKEMVENIL